MDGEGKKIEVKLVPPAIAAEIIARARERFEAVEETFRRACLRVAWCHEYLVIFMPSGIRTIDCLTMELEDFPSLDAARGFFDGMHYLRNHHAGEAENLLRELGMGGDHE